MSLVRIPVRLLGECLHCVASSVEHERESSGAAKHTTSEQRTLAALGCDPRTHCASPHCSLCCHCSCCAACRSLLPSSSPLLPCLLLLLLPPLA